MNKRNRKKGLFSATVVVIVLIAAIAANVLVTKMNWSYDVSENKMYTLSDQTKKIVKGIGDDKDDITFYVLSAKTDFNKIYKQILNEYVKLSGKIKVEYKDLENYPNFAKDYTDPDQEVYEGSIIVESGKKSRYLSVENFVNYSFDYATYNQVPESLGLESLITEAINYVTSENTPVIYTLTGHNEMELNTATQGYIQADNYEIRELNLLTEEKIPEDCEILWINGPRKDLSKEDAKKIRTYMKGDGKIFFAADATADGLTNFESLLKDYGITMEKGIVVEGDQSHYMQIPTCILPSIEASTITQSLAKQFILVPITKGFSYKDGGDDYTVIPLLTTTEKAYSKVNTNSSVITKEKGDISGPLHLGLMVDTEKGGKMIVLGSVNLLDEQMDAAVSGTNTDFVLNGINYLAEQENKIAVRPKTLGSARATVSAFAQKSLMIGTVFVLPAVVILLGIMVVVKRRRR